MTGNENSEVINILPHDGRPLDFSILKPCDILVEPAHDIYGVVARLFGEPDQHALLVHMDTRRAWEAVGNGVQANQISTKKPYRVYRIKGITDEARYQILEAAYQDQYKPYGFYSLVAHGVWKVTGKYPALGNDDQLPLVCSGWIARWCAKSELDLTPGIAHHLVQPDDLANSPLVERVY